LRPIQALCCVIHEDKSQLYYCPFPQFVNIHNGKGKGKGKVVPVL